MKKYLIILISIFFANAFSQDTAVFVELKEQIDPVFLLVENMPIFSKECEGAENETCTTREIQQYASKVKYPEVAIMKGQTGKVYLSFIVNTEGEIIDVTILRSCGYPILDNASLNHIKDMPDFYKPGFQRGKAVKVKYQVPIVFELYGKAKKNKKR